MHKRETLKIVLMTIAVLAVIVINALILTKREPDILDIPETPEATKPVPDFSAYTDVKEKKSAFFLITYAPKLKNRMRIYLPLDITYKRCIARL